MNMIKKEMTRWIIERSDGMFYTPYSIFAKDLEYAKLFDLRFKAVRVAKKECEGEKVEVKKVKVTIEY